MKISKIKPNRVSWRMSFLWLLFALILADAGIGHRAYALTPTVKIPTLSPNERVVSLTTPQDYGAVADGVTDCTAAFQAAMDAVHNAGSRNGGGVVYVPAGQYAFYGNLTIPIGVTLHGDWKDWTKGTGGAVGTIFKVYTTGAANGTPFVTVSCPAGLKGVTFWYPNQNASSIQPYPYTIHALTDCTVQNVILVNSYQGISAPGSRHQLSTIVGSPLSIGIYIDGPADVPITEDIRFSPNVWPSSGLPGSPSATGPHKAWMRNNGSGMFISRTDGEICNKTYIEGYLVGINATKGVSGSAGAQFYEGAVTDCGTALLFEDTSGHSGLQFSWFTLDGDVGIDRTTTTQPNLKLHSCNVIGRNGIAFRMTGGDWKGWALFNHCNITGQMIQNSAAINLVNCTINAPVQCTMGTGAVYAGFTGCTFLPSQNIVNNAGANKLKIDSRPAIPNQLPKKSWDTVIAAYQACNAAKTTLFVATNAPYNAVGDGLVDDTAAIQSALNAAGANGGGIVYLPGGQYKTTTTLTVPTGVELRGPWEMRHNFLADASKKSKGSRILPYGGQGNAAGPVAIALNANSGVVGVDVVYETQNASTPIVFPAAIQGRGANVYAIGISCPNAYYYVDFDTYTCTNHFLYMINGTVIQTGIKSGNGSSGVIANFQINSSFWGYLQDSASKWNSALNTYTKENMKLLEFGNCTETVWSSFGIFCNTMLHTNTELGKGPNVLGLGLSCDVSFQGLKLEGNGTTNVNLVNPWMAISGITSSPDSSECASVLSTSTFQGMARLFNQSLFSQPTYDYNIGGGDIGIDLVQMLNHGRYGAQVSGGTLRLINHASYAVNGTPPFVVYDVIFGPGAGLPGKVSEVIAGYCNKGFNIVNNSPNNPINMWANYAQSTALVVEAPQASYQDLNEGLYRPVTASTTGSSFTTAAVNDGNLTTRWSSNYAENQWIYLDLQSRKQIANVALNWEAAYGKGFKLQVSDDASTWTDVYSTTTGTGGNQLIPVNGAGRYVRMYGTQRFNPIWGYSLWELGVQSNLALNRPLVVSSTRVQTPAVPAVYANDGNPNTRWSSNANNNEWIYVDLQSVRQISSIDLDWEAAYATAYKIQVSNDAVNWTDIYSTTNGRGGLETIAVSATGRYVKMQGVARATGYGYSLWEFGVY